MIAVQRRKLGILNFSAAAGMDTNAVLMLYLIAAADPQEPVSRYPSLLSLVDSGFVHSG